MPALHIVEYTLRGELEHGLYVSRLAQAVAGEMGCDKETVRTVAVAGLLHDIGKLRLMNYINGEENTLVTTQMKYVRMHSTLSYEIAKAHGYPEEVLEAVRFHHENYDGTGYPDGLRGEAIPLAARIIRVSDVFAALTTDRPYRSAFPFQTALELMIEEITHFDLEVFLAFQRVAHRNGTSFYARLDEEMFSGTLLTAVRKLQEELVSPLHGEAVTEAIKGEE